MQKRDTGIRDKKGKNKLLVGPPAPSCGFSATIELFELEGAPKSHLIPLPAVHRDPHSPVSAHSPPSLTLGVYRDGHYQLSGQLAQSSHHPYWKQLLHYTQSRSPLF